MKFYTGAGDGGTSALWGSGERISKTDSRFEALGSLDELNSYLGVCRSLATAEDIKNTLKILQEDLFIVQAEIGSATTPSATPLSEGKVTRLESMIDRFAEEVGEIRVFTIAGGSILSAHLDYARALARASERRVLAIRGGCGPATLAYLNRISSLLYILARYANKKAGITEEHPAYE